MKYYCLTFFAEAFNRFQTAGLLVRLPVSQYRIGNTFSSETGGRKFKLSVDQTKYNVDHNSPPMQHSLNGVVLLKSKDMDGYGPFQLFTCFGVLQEAVFSLH